MTGEGREFVSGLTSVVAEIRISRLCFFGAPPHDARPMSNAEKTQLIVSFAIMAGYPLVFMILVAQTLYLVITAAGLVAFFGALFKFKCSRCVNFSCPFNRVPKPVVQAYLARNPVIQQTLRIPDLG